MEFVAGLSPWQVVTADGSSLAIRASGYTDVGPERVFIVLVDASAEEQTTLDVVSRTPVDPRRVDAAIVRIPIVRIPIARIRSTLGG